MSEERVKWAFPRRTLEDAMRVPTALKQHNAGNAWPPADVAKALGVAPKGNTFFYVASAAQQYGLTIGGRDAGEIALTDLGRQAVLPQSREEEQAARLIAFLSVPEFKEVLEYFKGNNLPEPRFRENTLQRKFGLEPAVQEEFVTIFEQNCRYLGIGHEWPTTGAAGLATDRREPSDEDPSSSVVVAAPAGGGDQQPTCFVIMPFVERDERHATGFFTEVLKNVFTPALTAAGFVTKTARRQGTDIIQSTIVNDLLDADLVLADLTEHNPNVLFELGMRMAVDKPVALVRAKGTGPIFDVDNMLRVEEYNPNVWPSTVESDVPRIMEHVQATWDNRGSGVTFMQLLHRGDDTARIAR